MNFTVHIFNNKNISLSTKVNAFNTYIQSIFLYNSAVDHH